MQTLRVIAVLLFFGLGILAYSLWGHAGRQVLTPVKTLATALHENRPPDFPIIKEIQLEYHQPELPPGPGYMPFATQCVVCHSPRYVLNQPRLTRKTWTTEVTKMVNAYGAPIPLDQQKEIVNYLVFWHGQEDVASPPSRGTRSGAKQNK